MRTLYNILFRIFFLLSSPYYFMRMRRRGNWRNGFAERFGKFNVKLKQSITNRQVLWLHAVSVGEVNLCTQLINALRVHLAELGIVAAQGDKGLEELLAIVADDGDERLPVDGRASVIVLAAQLEALQKMIGSLEKRIKMQHRNKRCEPAA